MSITPSSEQRRSGSSAAQDTSRAPAAVRASLLVLAAFGLGSAVLLWAERGPALLLDLAHMGATFLCL